MESVINRLRSLSETVMLKYDALFWTFIVVNIIGFVWGVVGWYGAQLPLTPLVLWHFVPDCPLVAGYFALALWGRRQGKKWTAFNLFVAMGLIKYGVWTCFVWLLYWQNTGDFPFISIAMFTTHLGLIAQGVVLLLLTERWRVEHVIPAFLYYIVADYVDYGLGHYPMYPERYVPPFLVQWHTVFMTWALGLVFMILGWRQTAETPATRQPAAQV